eukprot:scaffold2029_cov73-Phaeocystis_antarctica.AAC.2
MHLRVVDVDFGVKGGKFPARLLDQLQQHALVLGYTRLVRLEQHLPNSAPVKPLLCQPAEEVALGALNVDLQNVDAPMAEREPRAGIAWAAPKATLGAVEIKRVHLAACDIADCVLELRIRSTAKRVDDAASAPRCELTQATYPFGAVAEEADESLVARPRGEADRDAVRLRPRRHTRRQPGRDHLVGVRFRARSDTLAPEEGDLLASTRQQFRAVVTEAGCPQRAKCRVEKRSAQEVELHR